MSAVYVHDSTGCSLFSLFLILRHPLEKSRNSFIKFCLLETGILGRHKSLGDMSISSSLYNPIEQLYPHNDKINIKHPSLVLFFSLCDLNIAGFAYSVVAFFTLNLLYPSDSTKWGGKSVVFL